MDIICTLENILTQTMKCRGLGSTYAAIHGILHAGASTPPSKAKPVLIVAHSIERDRITRDWPHARVALLGDDFCGVPASAIVFDAYAVEVLAARSLRRIHDLEKELDGIKASKEGVAS